MTARSFGEILGGAKQKAARTYQPIHRCSYNVGEREDRFYRPVPKSEVGARMRAAQAYDVEYRAQGKRNGPLGHIGLEVLRQLYRMCCPRTGRLDPAINTIAQKIRRGRTAVFDALAALKRHGFLDWIRRTEPTGNEGAGPQVKQASNAYRLDLPAKARALVAKIVGRAPRPVDDEARRAGDAAETDRMVASLPLREEMATRISDPLLAAVLARFGEAVASQERESAKRDESGQSRNEG
ncbi:replication protein A [Sphingomonas prati]|uniref:Replication protein A n=1 Tax=Sphingomonas prati TaxID=1843237 RepID=A0A7W9F078_9SPHN|nr:replication protein A [Sphingomonas prati]MBB5727953.1 hypothetical protein [Sphingomonas prati]GGE82156.1 hypothetical protein GCM10011404_13490 [Sphingomonas prati]